MISAAKKLARLLLASAAAAGFVAPAVSAPLSADPNVRQLSNRKNYEPGGKYFLFGNARGGVQKRNGKINIRTSPPVAAGNMETETVYFGGRYGYETKFGGHPWQAHGPFDETAARNGKGKGAGVADGFGATNYVYSISATKVHPANGYDGPQGGNFPPPKGARDIYSYSVSGSASRSRMVEPQKAPCVAGVSCPASPFFNHIPPGTETHSDRHIREGAQEQSPTARKNIEDAVRLARAEALRTEEIAKGITRVRDFEQAFHTDKPYGFTADQLAAFGRGEASPLGWLVANGTGVEHSRIRPEYITPEYIGPTDGNTVPDWIRQPLKQDADVLAKTANALTKQGKAQLTEWDGNRSFPANAAQKVAGAAGIIKTARDGLAETTVGKKIGAATDAVTPDALKNGIGKLVDAGNRRMTGWAGNDPDRKAYAAAAGGVIGIVADSRLPGKGRGKNRHKHSGEENPNHSGQTHDRADLDGGRNPSKARDTNHSGASGNRHHAGGQPESPYRPDSSRNPDRPRQESPKPERPTRDRPNSLPNRPDTPKSETPKSNPIQQSKSDYKRPVESRASPEVVADYQRRADALRSEFSHKDINKYGNVGIADIDIVGVDTKTLAAHSKIREKNKGFIGDGKTQFDSLELPSFDKSGNLKEPYNRNKDAEYQLFSNIADRLGNNYQATGKITIYTEKPICASCSNVAQQFKSRYPNISVQIIDSNGRILTY